MQTIRRFLALYLALLPLMGITAPAGAPLAPAAQAGNRSFLSTDQPSADDIGDYIWTHWNPQQYALADDGDVLWIGTAMGIVRWDKATGAHQRYTRFEGFPSNAIYAVAIDAAGNRWFGGDGGLSRLDASGHWTHFDSTNSGLHATMVDGIAIGANGVVWLSHGLPAGSISRLAPDGSWRWFPDRTSAVSLDFAEIVQTRNDNRLWTAARDEVWVGYNVFNGLAWQYRPPPDPSDVPYLVADLLGNVYTATDIGLGKWDGTSWRVTVLFVTISQIAVDAANRVWIGYMQWVTQPYRTYYVSRVGEFGYIETAEVPSLPQGLLASGEGRWAIGANWLLEPGATSITTYPDLPARRAVADVLVGSDGRTWVVSEYVLTYIFPFRCESTLQLVDDRGTARLDDDRWQSIELPGWMTRSEPMPGGDVLYVINFPGPYGQCNQQSHIQRWRAGELLAQYDAPGIGDLRTVFDIYAEDDRRIWFAYRTMDDVWGIAGVDDRGTPTTPGDDRWVNYLLPPQSNQQQIALAVDLAGRVWYADATGTYRREGGQWRTIQGHGALDLTPTADGSMLLHGLWESELSAWNRNVTNVIDGNDQIGEWMFVRDFIMGKLAVAQAAVRRNIQWRVASDRAIWFVEADFPSRLARYDGHSLTRTPSIYPNNITGFEVSGSGRVWIRQSDTALLSRLSPQPDFTLISFPRVWIQLPGSTSVTRQMIGAVEGFNLPVTLSLVDLPSGVTADFNPNPVRPQSPVTVTIQVDAGVALGTYLPPSVLLGVADSISHTLPVTVVVAPEIHTRWFPLALHKR